MSCNNAGNTRYFYTGNQVGDFNYVGYYNFVAGGPASSGISSGVTVGIFFRDTLNRRIWESQSARLDDQLLDAAYPTINLQWFAEITLEPGVVFRVSNRAFYVQDEDGNNRFYDARAEKPPVINVTVGEWLSPNYEVSDLSLSLNNRDGFYNRYLPMGDDFKQWSDAKIIVKVGFGEQHSNYFALFEGQVTVKQGISTTRDTIEIRAYDKLDLDEIPIPPNSFSVDTYPDISEDAKGKAVPLVYGDWTTEVPTYGAVAAYCINAEEEGATEFRFKVSDVSLMSLASVWVHRGERNAENPEGPIQINPSVIDLDLDLGEFSIPSDVVALDQAYFLATKAKAGVGSAVNFITSDSNLNFVTLAVKANDTVTIETAYTATGTVQDLAYTAAASGAAGNAINVNYTTGGSAGAEIVTVVGSTITVQIQSGASTANQVRNSIQASGAASALVKVEVSGSGSTAQAAPSGPTYLSGGQDAGLKATVVTVANFQLILSGNVIFREDTEYSISTTQFNFIKGDKFSVVCRGKDLNLLSINRLSDVSIDILRPQGISIDVDGSFWIADDATQKVYKLSFRNETIKEIAYTDIDPAITKVSGVSIASDNQLWVVDPMLSKIFRYNHVDSATGVNFTTGSVTGMPGTLANVTGIVAKTDNKIWIVDEASDTFYEIDVFSSTNPFVVTTFTKTAFDALATETLDISYDEQEMELVIVDRTTNKCYRLDPSDGSLNSSFSLSVLGDNVSYVTGCAAAPDGTLFFVDQGTLSVYNWNEAAYASENPGFIARDLLQKFGGHVYSEFDTSWNQTSRQLQNLKARLVVTQKSNVISLLNQLLRQYNTVFHLRFNKFALFWITFENFRTTGRLVKEKDIKVDTFKPGKEINQYFNSATANYGTRPFQSSTLLSDTYVSPAGVSFAGREVNRKLDLPNVYRRSDLDQLMPLFVRLSVPEPEFVDVTFGFRVLRTQMQDFLNVHFDGDINCVTGIKESGRRYNMVPCMVRKLVYDLGPMTVGMKLWSLGTTAFPGYTPSGRTVGGDEDTIVLTNVGRAGRISPIGTITGSTVDSVTLSDVDAQNAETRSSPAGLAWTEGYRVSIVDGATKAIVATATIDSVSGGTVTFTDVHGVSISNTTTNAAGFITGGHYLQYADYTDQIVAQKAIYGSFTRPITDYPTSRTRELEEQRGGVHNFDDSGVPYVFYPEGFISY